MLQLLDLLDLVDGVDTVARFVVIGDVDLCVGAVVDLIVGGIGLDVLAKHLVAVPKARGESRHCAFEEVNGLRVLVLSLERQG